MVERKGGLGRGLAALIPTGPAALDLTLQRLDAAPRDVAVSERQPGFVDQGLGQGPDPVAGSVYREIDVTAIRPNPQQPRTVFDEESITELEHSIREFGLLQPIVVRESTAGSYELVMGERRWRAAQRAGLDRIPAIVRQTGDDAMLRDALLENIHRVQLNPLEEAAAYEQLLEEFGVTHHQLADRLGRSRPAVTNTIRLLKLPMSVQRRVAVGVLAAGHARALLGLDDPGRQEELATRIVAEGLSVRATEEAVVLSRRERPQPQRPARRRPPQPDGVRDVATRLSDTLDTKVRVELGQRKGRIVVEFGSVADLERIAELMTPSSGREVSRETSASGRSNQV